MTSSEREKYHRRKAHVVADKARLQLLFQHQLYELTDEITARWFARQHTEDRSWNRDAEAAGGTYHADAQADAERRTAWPGRPTLRIFPHGLCILAA